MGFLSSLFGSSKSQPRTTTTITTPKLPPEIAPKVEEIADEAKRLYDIRVAEGYLPYEGATIAPFTEQEIASQEAIQDLVGTSRPLQEEALAITRQQAERFTPEVAQEFMNPYQQAVIDIEKREAQKDFESKILPEFEKQAVGAGGLSGLGSRAGVQAALLGEAQMQRLGDIQARGLQQAFDVGRAEFAAQKARERGQAQDISRVGPAMFAAGLAEQGALAGVGEQRRGMAQEALDEAYFRFLEEREEPARALAQYSNTIYGNPLASLSQTTAQTTTPGIPGQSRGSQLLGLGLQAASTYYGGGFGAPRTRKEGGRLDEGLSGVVYRQEAGAIGMVPEERRVSSSVSEEAQRMKELARLAAQLKDAGSPDKAKRVLATMRRPATEGPSIVIDDPTTRSGRRAEDLALGLSGIGMPVEDQKTSARPSVVPLSSRTATRPAPTPAPTATPPARPATPATGLPSLVVGDTDMGGSPEEEAKRDLPSEPSVLVRETLGELGRTRSREETLLDRAVLAARAREDRESMLAKQRKAEQARFDDITATQKKRLADQYALRRQEIEGRDWNMTLSKAFGVAAQAFSDPNKSLVEQIASGLGGMSETMVAERLLQREQLSGLEQEKFDKETAIINAQLENQLAVLKENNKQDFNLLNLDLEAQKEFLNLEAGIRSAIIDDAAKLAEIVDDIADDIDVKTGKLDTYYKMVENRIYKEEGVTFKDDGVAYLNNRPLTSEVARMIEAKIRVANEKLLKAWLARGGTDVSAAIAYSETFPSNKTVVRFNKQGQRIDADGNVIGQ
jgi:hypothetical protein